MRLGRFSIRDQELKENWEKYIPLFKDMVIVKCEIDWSDPFGRSYLALCNSFEEREEGQEAAYYHDKWWQNEDGSVEFRGWQKS